jgi:hypothetical protein
MTLGEFGSQCVLVRVAVTKPDVCISELKTAHGFTDKEAKAFLWVYDRTFHYVCEPEPHDPPDPLPQFAKRRRGPDPAQDPWTKWLPDIEAFRDAA